MIKKPKHKSFHKRKIFEESGYLHIVSIPWATRNWNEICANVMEVFGLPNERWLYHTSAEYITFHFKSKKDKVLCELLLSEHL
jgi:hypothetical protein